MNKTLYDLTQNNCQKWIIMLLTEGCGIPRTEMPWSIGHIARWLLLPFLLIVLLASAFQVIGDAWSSWEKCTCYACFHICCVTYSYQIMSQRRREFADEFAFYRPFRRRPDYGRCCCCAAKTMSKAILPYFSSWIVSLKFPFLPFIEELHVPLYRWTANHQLDNARTPCTVSLRL